MYARGIDLDANYAILRQQILDLLNLDGENSAEQTIFQDEIYNLLALADEIYEQESDDNDARACLLHLHCLIWQMLHASQDEHEFAELLAEIQAKSAYSEAWKRMQVLLEKVLQREFQALMMATMRFYETLKRQHKLIKLEGQELLRVVSTFKSQVPKGNATVIQVLQQSSELLSDVPAGIAAYQKYADRVAGKSSMVCKVLGRGLQAFGIGVYVIGFATMLATLSVFPASAAITLPLAFTVMLAGFGTWTLGSHCVEKSRVTGLAESMSFFATTATQFQPRPQKNKWQHRVAEDEFPLDDLRRQSLHIY